MAFTAIVKLIIAVLLNGIGPESPTNAFHSWPGKRLPTLIERWQADVIVFAYVERTESDDGGQSSRLKVISVIKSNEPKVQDEVSVFIQLGSHWPYQFTAKRKAIAFLRFDEKRGKYTDFNGRDGGIDVDEGTAQLFIDQYAKLPEILKSQDARDLLARKVEWYVKFALHSNSRFEATHGLEILWHEALEQKLLTNEECSSPDQLLTESQKKKICQLFAEGATGNDLYFLIRFLGQLPSPEIDRYLKKSLQLSLSIDEAVPVDKGTDAGLAFELLPERVGFELPKSLDTAYDDYQKRQSHFWYNVRLSDENTEADKQRARESLITQWRTLVKEFLQIPEVQVIDSR